VQRNFFEVYYLEASKGHPNIADNPTIESLIEETTYFAVLSSILGHMGINPSSILGYRL